jgi:hypothetical protein
MSSDSLGGGEWGVRRPNIVNGSRRGDGASMRSHFDCRDRNGVGMDGCVGSRVAGGDVRGWNRQDLAEINFATVGHTHGDAYRECLYG